MINILLVIFLIIVILIILSLSFFNLKRNIKSAKKTLIIPSRLNHLERQEFNPDKTTDNWDLHKFRLEKFRRSHYKGLTFFLSSENRVYYLSEEGDKVYC